MKRFLIILTLFYTNLLFCQEKDSDTLYLFINLNSKTVEYTIGENVNFKIYRKGYELEKTRDSLKALYKFRGKKVDIKNVDEVKKINPKDLPRTEKIPQMVIDFFSKESPIKFNDLFVFKYIDENEFRLNESKYLSKKTKFIIYKDLNNEYYICEVFVVEQE